MRLAVQGGIGARVVALLGGTARLWRWTVLAAALVLVAGWIAVTRGGSAPVAKPAAAPASDSSAPDEPLPPAAQAPEGAAAGAPVVPAAAVRGALPYAEVPGPALAAYQRAATVIDAASPACRLDWIVLASIASLESRHGTGLAGGHALDAAGRAVPPVVGVAFDGRDGRGVVDDTDAGVLDGDPVHDAPVGPFGFLPATWTTIAVDADHDGVRDPQDVDDAALAAAVQLCAGGGDLSTPEALRTALTGFRAAPGYADAVLAVAAVYREQAAQVAAALPVVVPVVEPVVVPARTTTRSAKSTRGTKSASAAAPPTPSTGAAGSAQPATESATEPSEPSADTKTPPAGCTPAPTSPATDDDTPLASADPTAAPAADGSTGTVDTQCDASADGPSDGSADQPTDQPSAQPTDQPSAQPAAAP